MANKAKKNTNSVSEHVNANTKATKDSKSEESKDKAEAEADAKEVKPLLSSEEALMRMGAIEKLQNAKTEYMTFKEFEKAWDEDWNPGKRAKGAELPLYAGICEIGLKVTPVVGFKVKGLGTRGLQGHLRARCVKRMHKENPEAYMKHFSNGIRVLMVSGLTEVEAYFLACDHDTVARDRIAVIDQGMVMFNRGCTEKDVCLTLWVEFEGVYRPVKGDRIVAIRNAKTAAEAEKEMCECRRGVTQQIKAFTKLPKEIYDYYKNDYYGIEDVPTLNGTQVTKLGKANKGGSKHDTTPKYKGDLKQFLAINRGDVIVDVKRPLSVTKLDEEISKLGSKTAKLIMFKVRYGLPVSIVESDEELMKLEADGVLNIAEDYEVVAEYEAELKAKAEKASKKEKAEA